MIPKCPRCRYCWLHVGSQEVKGMLHMVDLGICPKCQSVKSRVKTASPGDQVNAELWGKRFEGLMREG